MLGEGGSFCKRRFHAIIVFRLSDRIICASTRAKDALNVIAQQLVKPAEFQALQCHTFELKECDASHHSGDIIFAGLLLKAVCPEARLSHMAYFAIASTVASRWRARTVKLGQPADFWASLMSGFAREPRWWTSFPNVCRLSRCSTGNTTAAANSFETPEKTEMTSSSCPERVQLRGWGSDGVHIHELKFLKFLMVGSFRWEVDRLQDQRVAGSSASHRARWHRWMTLAQIVPAPLQVLLQHGSLAEELPSLAPTSQAQGGTLVFAVCSHVLVGRLCPATQRSHWRAVAFDSFRVAGLRIACEPLVQAVNHFELKTNLLELWRTRCPQKPCGRAVLHP